jgi:hypothetical protein
MIPARVITGAEEAILIEDIRKRLPLPKVGDVTRWERGWTENWEAYSQSGDVADLRPKYIRQGQPMRLHGKFVMPVDEDAEWTWYQEFREKLFDRWFRKSGEILEFGSGSGHNLAWMHESLCVPVAGLDWSWAAVKIADTIDTGYHFDFYNPVLPNFRPRTGVLTIGALEQTGGRRWTPFMEELLLAKPSICVHVEPIVEWYDPANPVDKTAIDVHEAKGFWVGFWDWCKARRREGKIEILEARRTGVGSLMVEGYSVIVWRPV